MALDALLIRGGITMIVAHATEEDLSAIELRGEGGHVGFQDSFTIVVEGNFARGLVGGLTSLEAIPSTYTQFGSRSASSRLEVMVHAWTANIETNPAAFSSALKLQYFDPQNHSSGQVLCGSGFCINSEISYRRLDKTGGLEISFPRTSAPFRA